MTTKDDELSQLKAEQAQMAKRIAELERAAQPPPPAPDFGRYQRYDPTEGMSMDRSVMREMARAVPDGMVRDIAMRDNRAPVGPSAQGVIPSSQGVGSVRTGGVNTGGWVEPRSDRPPGIDLIDRGVNAALPHGREW
jgi:hypothetical protein